MLKANSNYDNNIWKAFVLLFTKGLHVEDNIRNGFILFLVLYNVSGFVAFKNCKRKFRNSTDL